MVQVPRGDLFLELLVSSSDAAMASSNAFLTLSCRRAEHSTYDVALISDASLLPSERDTVLTPFNLSCFT